jgi:hypothetical protein
MKSFECESFVIENFNPNDRTDLGALGCVEHHGRDSYGRDVYRFIHSYEHGAWIAIYPRQFRPLKNVFVIEKGVLSDGTPVHLVAMKDPAIFQWQWQMFQFG